MASEMGGTYLIPPELDHQLFHDITEILSCLQDAQNGDKGNLARAIHITENIKEYLQASMEIKIMFYESRNEERRT